MKVKIWMDRIRHKHSFRLYLRSQRIYRFIRKRHINDLYGHFIGKPTGSPQYVILRYDSRVGIMCALRYYVFNYMYFSKQNIIPILDIQPRFGIQDNLVEKGKDSIWDHCFEQVITAEEAYKQESVYVTPVCPAVFYFDRDCKKINGITGDFGIHLRMDEGWRNYYKRIKMYCSSWLHFKPIVIEYVRKNFDSKVYKDDRILGVLLREEFSQEMYDIMSDECKRIMDHHPRVPNLSETIEIVKKYMKKWDCNKIFLATMQSESVLLFQKEFGDQVFFCDRKRISADLYRVNPSDMSDCEFRDKHFPINKDIQYTGEIIALSKCDCFIGAVSGGAIGAMILNGGMYDEVMILGEDNPDGDYCKL